MFVGIDFKILALFLHGLAPIDMNPEVMHFAVIQSITVILAKYTMKPSLLSIMIGIQPIIVTEFPYSQVHNRIFLKVARRRIGPVEV